MNSVHNMEHKMVIPFILFFSFFVKNICYNCSLILSEMTQNLFLRGTLVVYLYPDPLL